MPISITDGSLVVLFGDGDIGIDARASDKSSELSAIYLNQVESGEIGREVAVLADKAAVAPIKLIFLNIASLEVLASQVNFLLAHLKSFKEQEECISSNTVPCLPVMQPESV